MEDMYRKHQEGPDLPLLLMGLRPRLTAPFTALDPDRRQVGPEAPRGVAW